MTEAQNCNCKMLQNKTSPLSAWKIQQCLSIKPTQKDTYMQFFTIVWSAKKSSLALCWASTEGETRIIKVSLWWGSCTQSHKKLKKKDLSRGGNYTALCWGGKNEAGISELAGNITFRNILFFIRVVSDSYAFNNIHPPTKERITQALGT